MKTLLSLLLFAILAVFLIKYFALQEFIMPVSPPSSPNVPCPKLSDHQYPSYHKDVEALFQHARRLEKKEEAKPFKEQDYREVLHAYHIAANKGHWKAMNNLGILYDVGYVVPENRQKAKALFSSMVDMGVPEGYINMAEYAESRQYRNYLRKAAETGHPRSQYIYAISLYKTRQSKNIKIGEQWMQCSFEGGYADAAFSLGADKESDGNEEQTYYYYKQGAMMGSSMCMMEMREIYLYGRYGKKKDPKRAECFNKLDDLLDDDPKKTFPNIDELCPPSEPS